MVTHSIVPQQEESSNCKALGKTAGLLNENSNLMESDELCHIPGLYSHFQASTLDFV